MDKSRENGIGVWGIDSGETVWIAAASEEEAIAYYHAESLGDVDDDGEIVVTQILDLDVEAIADLEQSEETYISYRDLLRMFSEFPTTIASTNY